MPICVVLAETRITLSFDGLIQQLPAFGPNADVSTEMTVENIALRDRSAAVLTASF